MKKALLQGWLGSGGKFAAVALLFGCAIFGVAAARGDTVLDVRFFGPDFIHIIYGFDIDENTKIKLEAEGPDGTTTVVGETTGPATLETAKHRHTGLSEGQHTYLFSARSFDKEEEEWGPWVEVRRTTFKISPRHVLGRLLFNESLSGVSIANITVPEEQSLTFYGEIGTTGGVVRVDVFGDLHASGARFVSHTYDDDGGVVQMEWPPSLRIYRAKSFSGVVGGVFEFHAVGSSISDCSGLTIVPFMGGTVANVSGGGIDLSCIDSGATLEVENCDLGAASRPGFNYLIAFYGPQTLRGGEVTFKDVVWHGPMEVEPTASFSAVACDFKYSVSVGSRRVVNESGGAYFTAQESLFNSFYVASPTFDGDAEISGSLFAGDVGISGGAPVFNNCEFGQGVRMRNRTAARIHGSLFLKPLAFEHPYITEEIEPISPLWYEANVPSPTINRNSFMGKEAFYYCMRSDYRSGVPATPIYIGANFYGSPVGIHREEACGFLPPGGYPATGDGYPGNTILDVAKPYASSPLAAGRKDSRVLPRFWLNGHIVGQNTIPHFGGGAGTSSQRTLIRGRRTLLSLDISCTEHRLDDVTIYAEWDGKKVLPRQGAKVTVYRDPALLAENMIRNDKATVSFILPGVDKESEHVTVFVEPRPLPGYVAGEDPEQRQVLLSETIKFKAPPARKLVVWAIPVSVRGVFSSWGSGNAAGVVDFLKKEIPDKLPITPDKLRVRVGPPFSYFSPTSFITTIGLLNQIASELAFARWLIGDLSESPDFIIAVMPQGMISGGAQGASFVGRRRIVFVDERYAHAALHELGHGIGLYTGKEQYDMYPPCGLPLERVTVFDTETSSRSEVIHLPGTAHNWYNKNLVYYDTMGSGDPSWPLVSTVTAFHEWFEENLQVRPQVRQALAGYEGDSVGVAGRKVATGFKRLLLNGNLDSYYTFLPETLRLFEASQLDLSAVPLNEGSAYRIYGYNARGEVIHEESFLPLRPDSESPDWVGTVDVPLATKACRIVKSSDLSQPVNITAMGLQNVTITTPKAGTTVGDTLTLSWRVASDTAPLPEQMRHLVYFRSAAAEPWELLAGPVAESELTVPTDLLPESNSLEFKVVSSDGLDSVVATVGNIKVPARPLRATITSPQSGTIGATNGVWHLTAEVVGLGALRVNEERWSSSLQGELGMGSRIGAVLEEGNHKLRYEATLSNGSTVFAEVAVEARAAVDFSDLGLAENGIILGNALSDPAGYRPQLLELNATNRFTVRLNNNGGSESVARLRFYLTRPGGVETLVGTRSLEFEPFAAQSAEFDVQVNQTGIHSVRAVVDQVSPLDATGSSKEQRRSYGTTAHEVTLNKTPPAGGAVSGADVYIEGAAVTVSATPYEGFYFKGWKESAIDAPTFISHDADYTFTATAERHLWAVFSQNPAVTLTASPVVGGTVSGAGNYNAGDKVTLQAVAAAEYIFVNWTEGDTEVSKAATYTFTINESRDLTANFRLENPPPELTLYPTEHYVSKKAGKLSFQIINSGGTAGRTTRQLYGGPAGD